MMVKIDYRCLKAHDIFPDIHIFTSKDEPGLYIAHHDLKLALSSIRKTIKTLRRLNSQSIS